MTGSTQTAGPRSVITGWLAPIALGVLGVIGYFLGFATSVVYQPGSSATQIDGLRYVPDLLLFAGAIGLVGLLPSCRPLFALPAAIGSTVLVVCLFSLVGEFEDSRISWGYWAIVFVSLLTTGISAAAAMISAGKLGGPGFPQR